MAGDVVKELQMMDVHINPLLALRSGLPDVAAADENFV
jgi:hypothetical protein